jgi:hypothetical protein
LIAEDATIEERLGAIIKGDDESARIQKMFDFMD